jgi:hypothetical protein
MGSPAPRVPAPLPGAAVLGSALTGRYQAGVPDHVARVPAQLSSAAHEALPAALAAAERLGPHGAALAARAQSAFVDGLGLAMTIAAGSALAAALFVLGRAPRLAGVSAERARLTQRDAQPRGASR